jgi:hypothetical protein
MVVKIIQITPSETHSGQQDPVTAAAKDAGIVEWKSRLEALAGGAALLHPPSTS